MLAELMSNLPEKAKSKSGKRGCWSVCPTGQFDASAKHCKVHCLGKVLEPAMAIEIVVEATSGSHSQMSLQLFTAARALSSMAVCIECRPSVLIRLACTTSFTC